MSRHNSCFVVGNVGMDPVETARSPKGGPIVKFSVAEDVSTYDEASKSYKTIHTNWFQVTAFGSVGERVMAALKRGARVAVQGRMKVSKFTDRSGEERNGFEILADDVALWTMLKSGQRSEAAASASRVQEREDREEDLPF